MAGKGWKGERTAIGSLYRRIQEVKSRAVMPWTGHTYSTGEIRFIDQRTLVSKYYKYDQSKALQPPT